jgi:ADP-heptose:LPS heptosyltransferase
LARLESAAPLYHPATYLDLYSEIARADLFIGNDSGPAHLAGIIGVNTLALFGPSNPTVWQPLGPRVSTLRGQPIANLTVDEAFAAACDTPVTLPAT